MATCDAEALLSSAAISKFTALSDGDKRAVLLQLMCNMSDAQLSWIGDYTAGNILVANGSQFVSQAPTTQIAVKTADENRTNTATIADDSELQLPLAADGQYSIQAVLLARYSGSSSVGAIKYQWAGPSVDLYREMYVRQYATTAAPSVAAHYVALLTALSQNHFFAETLTNGIVYAVHTMYIDVGAAGGTFRLQWAQNNSSANESSILAGSRIQSTKLN